MTFHQRYNKSLMRNAACPASFWLHRFAHSHFPFGCLLASDAAWHSSSLGHIHALIFYEAPDCFRWSRKIEAQPGVSGAVARVATDYSGTARSRVIAGRICPAAGFTLEDGSRVSARASHS